MGLGTLLVWPRFLVLVALGGLSIKVGWAWFDPSIRSVKNGTEAAPRNGSRVADGAARSIRFKGRQLWMLTVDTRAGGRSPAQCA
jgi:hypothetical protein